MNILVTGAGGFMGSHLVEMLFPQHNVLGTYYLPTVDIAEINPSIPIRELDVRKREDVKHLMATFKPDVIYHLAAQSYPTVSWKDPKYTFDTNILGTVNIFESLRELDLNPVVLVAGSSAAYGYVTQEEVPVKESKTLQPLHPYGISKVAQEQLSYQYFQNYGLKGIAVRIFNTTGPRKMNDVCSDFTKQAVMIEKGLQKEPMRVGNLKTRRAITDVRDILNAFILATAKGKPGETYNLSGSKAYLINDILNLTKSIVGRDFQVYQDPALMRPTDEPIIYGDSSKFSTQTGWRQTITIEKTLKDMVEYWRQKFGRSN